MAREGGVDFCSAQTNILLSPQRPPSGAQLTAPSLEQWYQNEA